MLLLVTWYVASNPTATYNFALFGGALAVASLAALLTPLRPIRLALLSAVVAGAGALGTLTASVGIVLIGVAASAFLGLRTDWRGRSGDVAVITIGVVVGLGGLIALWVAPKVLIHVLIHWPGAFAMSLRVANRSAAGTVRWSWR